MKDIKNSVALVVKQNDKFMIVQRPDDANDPLANVWGFPAITLKPEEAEIEAVSRAAKDKLGVEVNILRKIGDKTADRGTYILHLSDYEVSIVDGMTPRVPQADTSMTQYTGLKYVDDPTLLFDAARKQSLCSQVYLESINVEWQV